MMAFFRTIFSVLAFAIFTIHAQTPPPNDNWDDRITLTGTEFDLIASTYGATYELGDPAELLRFWDSSNGYWTSDPNAGSIWWSWTSPISARAILSLPSFPNVIERIRPQLVVYADSPVDLNTQIAGVLDIYPGYYTTFPINAGETYAIALVANAFTDVSYTIHFQVTTVPIILQHPQSQTVAAGNACFFTVVAPGYATNKNVRWTHNNNTIAGANGPSLLVQNASAASAGEYRAYVNILAPDAIAASEPATLTVEGPDIQPNVHVQYAVGSTNDLTLHILGETNQFYFLSYSTNSFTFDSRIFAPGAFYPYTHEPIPFLAHGAFIPFSSTADRPFAFFRAERAGDQNQACRINRHRIEAAKQTWIIERRASPGSASDDAAINNLMDGVRPTCPLGGSYTYNWVGFPVTCNLPIHQQ